MGDMTVVIEAIQKTFWDFLLLEFNFDILSKTLFHMKIKALTVPFYLAQTKLFI